MFIADTFNKEPQIVWIVIRQEDDNGVVGVYSSREKAISACTRVDDFLGPMEVDKTYNEPNWPGCYCPATMEYPWGP